MTELKPYGGPHAGDLHHVVENGVVVRNATALEVQQQRTIAVLEDQVKALMAHPDSYQSGFDDGRALIMVHAKRWKEWGQHQAAKVVPEGHRVVPNSISDDAIERLGIIDNKEGLVAVIYDRDDVKALYVAMVSVESKDKKARPDNAG